MFSYTAWTLSAIFWTLLMSFFSTQEMACISYNRLKLEAASKKGLISAQRIKFMVDNPLLLFGTTLFGVNLCLVISSESLRQAFESIGINPNLSALIHIPYVLIFGELVPMFAARLFPEHMARLGIPVLWFTSKVFQPIVTYSARIFSSLQRIFYGKAVTTSKSASIQLDELHEILNEVADGFHAQPTESSESSQHHVKEDRAHEGIFLDSIIGRILSMREKRVSHCMVRHEETTSFHILKRIDKAIASLYKMHSKDSVDAKAQDGIDLPSHILLKEKNNKLAGIVSVKSLFIATTCRIQRNTKDDDISSHSDNSHSSPRFLFQLAQPICYIAEEASLSEAFLRMKKEGVDVALILNQEGETIGYISLEIIIDELIPENQEARAKRSFHIEKTVGGDDDILTFAKQYGISPFFDAISSDSAKKRLTFSQYIEQELGRKPHQGDKVPLGPFILTVKESSLLGAKAICVTSL